MSSGSIGTPSSRHSGAEELALVRLQRVSPLRYVQSWQTPKHRCAPVAAKVVSTWCIAWCIAVRSFASSKSGAHQNFERIACKCFFSLARQSQADASPVRLRSLSDQVPTCLKCLDRLRSGAAGGRLKLRKCRRGPGERVGAGEVAKRHPLGGAEFAVIALGLHKSPYQQQELCRFAC